MIRTATLEDTQAIAEMGERFHAEAGWCDIAEYVVADCKQTLDYLVTSDDGILIVSEQDGRIVGMAGGACSPLYFNFAHKSGQEFFYYMSPEYRGSDGLRLLDALEIAAKSAGCSSWVMIVLDKVEPIKVGRLFSRRGYRRSEYSFIKRL